MPSAAISRERIAAKTETRSIALRILTMRPTPTSRFVGIQGSQAAQGFGDRVLLHRRLSLLIERFDNYLPREQQSRFSPLLGCCGRLNFHLVFWPTRIGSGSYLRVGSAT